MKIDHFDLLNKGNYGYNGKEKIKKMLDELPVGTILIIDSEGNGNKNAPQFMEDVAEYARSLGTVEKRLTGYTIYKKVSL